MERIKKAVEIAKANRSKLLEPKARPDYVRHNGAVADQPQGEAITDRVRAAERPTTAFNDGTFVRFNKWHLQSNRIVSDDASDPRGRSFEMLRTHLIQKVNETGHRLIGITSPSAGCGKTLCSVNLALSLVRIPETSVTLVDLDLRKPQVAGYLGLRPGPGVENFLRGEARIEEIAVIPESGQRRLRILPTFKPSREAAELLGSSRMKDIILQLRQQDPKGIILFDLPPVLVVDDVLSFLPNVEAILMVAAYGQTTTADLINAERLLGSDKVMGVILNKSEDNIATNPYY